MCNWPETEFSTVDQYPLAEAIAGLLRHYREQHDNPTVRDVYPSFDACAVGTGIPVGLLQRANRPVFPGFDSAAGRFQPASAGGA